MGNSVTPFLFHHPNFIFRNSENPILSFQDGSTLIHFSRIGASLISMDRAPFGSFVIGQGATENSLLTVVDKVVAWSKSNGVNNLLIKSFPEAYNPEQHALIKGALLKSGFVIQFTDVAQIVPVTDDAMKLNTHKKRRVRKAGELAYTFSHLPISFLEESYRLIVETRQNKGYPVTMSLNDLKTMFCEFPKAYMLFGAFDQKKLIAAAVCIEVNSQILYCFYIGDSLSHRTYSPVTFLVQGIYEFCKSQGFKIIDLGLSTDKGILNNGLYNFKKSFGSIDSVKLTFLKQL
ncbi:MAG TPA: hypothetical protein VFD46_07195 [Chryseolinea sp.]|nr:hypothetical protein [Chryseolinea sp.]